MGDEVAESCGCMTADWLNEQLADFMYTFENDPEGEFITRANNLCKQYRKTGEDFVSELIAFATNQKQTHIDYLILDAFEQMVFHKALQTNKDGSFSVSCSRNIFNERNENSWLEDSNMTDSMIVDFSNENVTLPEKYLSFTPIRKSVPDTAYQNRRDSGKIILKVTGKNFTLKQNDTIGSSSLRKVVVEKAYTDNYKNLIRFGGEKDIGQAEAIISRVQNLCNIIKEENKALADDEQIDFLSSTVLWGFIVNGTEDRLDASNCSLQCIDENATVIKLDLNNLKTYSVFPGKVVALRGTFVSDVFVADEIFEPKEPLISSLQKQSNIDLLHVWCACGPFTSAKTLSYEQLCDLLELIGPFIDRTSSAVKSAQCCYTYDEFMDMLLAKIDNALSDTDVQLLIVPNGRKDATLRPSFPTAPFNLFKQRKQQLSKNILLLPDPAIIRIAGVEFVITASEIIQHLGRDEIGRCEDQDRMSRLVRDLFRQRSLYPLYPANDDITYRLREAIKRTSLLAIPHVAILPSMLAPTVKVVCGSVFVNTNVLVRGSSGTYMKLKIDLRKTDMTKANSHISIADFCEVQIVQL
uniref:DNA polymerase alpha subunit B n=1 Tax=Setaria digitata TaxID=48799 RepID=A0A915PZ82_9BILA